jgi:hypothetical protein
VCSNTRGLAPISRAKPGIRTFLRKTIDERSSLLKGIAAARVQ